VNNPLRASGEQVLGEQFHPFVIDDNSRQPALAEHGQDALFRLLQAYRNVGCSCPASPEHGDAGIDSTGSENPDPGRPTVIALPATAAGQTGGQACSMFGQLSVSQGLPLADHSGGFRSHPAVMIDGASQVVIFNHLISTCSIAAGLIFSPVLELCVGAKYKHSSIVFDVATLLSARSRTKP
jgi:hypothetical protein